MPSVSYDLAIEILFRLFNPGGRALRLRRIFAVDFGICYLDHLKNSTDNPKKAAQTHRRTLDKAKDVHNTPESELIITPGGSYSPPKRAWLEKLLNISPVLTGLQDEVQLELDFMEQSGPATDEPERIATAENSPTVQGEGLSLSDLEIW